MKKYIAIALIACSIVSKAQINEPESIKHCSHDRKKGITNYHYNTLMDAYDVTCYFIDIEVSNQSLSVKGNTTIYAKATATTLNTFVFELNNQIKIDSIISDHGKVNYSRNNYETSVNFASPIAKDNLFNVKIYYNRPSNLYTNGIYHEKVDEWNKMVTYTLSEPFHAREWFPVKQDLNDKADSVFVFLTTDTKLKAGSNGLLSHITNISREKVRYEWKSYYPTAFYLISFAVSEYEEYTIYAHPEALNGDSILIQNYLYKNYIDNPRIKKDFNATSGLIELFSDKYSIYPFWKEKYGHCFVPLGGAMEHQTMTTTGSSLFYINAHELGHQWFGDQVTCATWQDIWINEGFASYSEYLAYEFLYNKEIAQDHLHKAQEYARQANTGSVYIPFDEVNDEDRIFNWQLTYRKGLCLVHMIRNEINNDEIFFNLLQNFQLSFANSVATGNDLQKFLTKNSTVNFEAFFEEWYYGEGYPTYAIVWEEINNNLRFVIEQQTTSENTPFFTTSIPITINGTELFLQPQKKYDTLLINNIYGPSSGIEIHLDPDFKVLKGLKSRLRHVNDITSSATIIANEFSSYPNPFKNELTIASSTTNQQKLAIYDLSGRTLLKAEFYNELRINTSHWQTGTYIVKLISNEEMKYQKIIKQ